MPKLTGGMFLMLAYSSFTDPFWRFLKRDGLYSPPLVRSFCGDSRPKAPANDTVSVPNFLLFCIPDCIRNSLAKFGPCFIVRV